jgi:hypothetical protein
MSSAEGGVRRGYTPRAALGVLDADGNALYAEGIKPSASCLIPVVKEMKRCGRWWSVGVCEIILLSPTATSRSEAWNRRHSFVFPVPVDRSTRPVACYGRRRRLGQPMLLPRTNDNVKGTECNHGHVVWMATSL